MSRRLSTAVLVAVLLVGLAFLLYPTVSDWWNSFHRSRAVANYVANVSNIDDSNYEKMLEEARAYNSTLRERGNARQMSQQESEEYESMLSVTDDGIMAYVEIPKINVLLPIYHGTDDTVLQTSIGHVVGTSLPVGGEGTHCVISGHRGLPSARLFTDLDKLVEGDTFTINVLDEVLTYEVDQIHIVLPNDLSDLQIVDGKDYCTLVTCTPYGINTHRLLVRGHRVQTKYVSNVRVTADALQVDVRLVAVCIAVPLLVLLALIAWIVPRKNRTTRFGSEETV